MEKEVYYQEAEVIWSWWKFAINRATDGTGATWIVFRLFDGKRREIELTKVELYDFIEQAESEL